MTPEDFPRREQLPLLNNRAKPASRENAPGCFITSSAFFEEEHFCESRKGDAREPETDAAKAFSGRRIA
jgi:hypothetical protein